MTNKQVAVAIREWVGREPRGRFSWPTDGCGYEQHLRFVEHRNAALSAYAGTFDQFCLDYAGQIEAEADEVK